MDGYTLMAKMRKVRRRFRLNATEQALFTELVEICNCEGWNDVFDCSNDELCMALLISENTLIKARNTLINAGLIYYKSGKSKRCVSSYSFTTNLKTTSKNEAGTSTNLETNTEVDTSANSADLYKLKTKIKKTSLSTGEQKFLCESLFKVMNKLLSDLVWLEPVCMNSHKTYTEIEDYLKIFFSELQGREDYHKTEREAKDHFSKWLSIQINNIQKQKGEKYAVGRTNTPSEPGKKRYGIY